MKAHLKLYDGLTVEVEGAKVQDLIKQVSEVENAIGYEPCGKCNSTLTYPQHRVAEANDFYELKCGACQAVLQLGTHKEAGTLYKKKMETDSKGKAVKKNDKAVYLKDGGWLRWNPETKVME